MEILKKYRPCVEDYLKNYFPEDGNLMEKSMSYSLLAGGKRLRPCLFLLVADLYNVDYRNLLPFAAGLEMIHTYSLIHDDLPAMDNDEYRRGKLTNHMVFGEAQGILAGDGLLTEAFSSFCRTVAPPALLLKAIKLAADLSGYRGMVGGQCLDIAKVGYDLSREELEEIHRGKTGALLSLAVTTGGILSDAPESDLSVLKEFGYDLGVLFQIADDILDVEGSFEEVGKDIGSDAENNKVTYITLLGKDGALSEGEHVLEGTVKKLDRLSVPCEPLKDLCRPLLYRNK